MLYLAKRITMQHKIIFSLVCLSLGVAAIANLKKDDISRDADPLAETIYSQEFQEASPESRPSLADNSLPTI